MAAAGQELQKLTECCICFKAFTDPRMLPCIHTFCLECLTQTGEALAKKPGQNMPCPLCRKVFFIPSQGMSGLQKNFFMQHLMDVTTMLPSNRPNISVIHCDVCKVIYEGREETKEATMRCLECGDSFCDFCSNSHKLHKLSKNHNIVKIGSETEDDIRRMYPTKNCNDHKQKPLDYYCPNCKRLVCVSCLLEEHLSHECKDVSVVEEEFRHAIENNALKIASYAEDLLSKGRKADERKSEFLIELQRIEFEIQRRNQELKEIIDKHTTSLLEEISLLKQNELKRFRMEEEEIEHFHGILKRFESYSTELCSKGSASDICGCFYKLLSQADELKKDHGDFLNRPSESIKVSFKERDLRKLLNIVDENIVGQIQDITPFKTFVAVVGLSDGGPIVTTEVVKVNLHRSNEISNLQQLPTEMAIGATAVVYSNTMYVTGIGADNDKIWKYKESYGWKKCASLVQGRRKHSIAFIDEVLYICGGFADSNGKVLKTVEAYDVFSLFTKCTTVGKLVHGVHSSGNCVPFRSSLYIFGGRDKHHYDVSYVQVYNTKQKKCTLIKFSKPFPRSFSQMPAVLWETSAILVGRNTCFIFNFETETWQEREQFKTEVIYFGLILQNERVFVIGGGIGEKNRDGKETWKCRDDVRYVPLQNFLDDIPIEWKLHATLPQPSMIHAYDKFDFL